jgi:site-specific DNA-methyltransferase (adenine-specific)
LLKKLLIQFTDVGETILDPFCGSATTGVACIETGRSFIGMELDEKYYQIAAKRLEEASMQLPLLEW